ncbi:MAG: rod shape-determining protein MreC [Alistipes sp.]|nr:rod shape-determining protein MreC [Alistipes sp.]
MYRLVEFLRRSYVTILFVVLEIAAVSFYIQSTPYTRARMLSKLYSVTGWAAGARSEVVSYFALAGENRALNERLALLEAEVAALRETAPDVTPEVAEDFPYSFIAARVVANTVNRPRNFITLNRGLRDGVVPESAVVTPSGAVVGYVLECSERYSVAMSILNVDFRTSGKIGESEYSGSIEWRGDSPYEITLCNLSKYADPEEGKRVLTTGFSHYFAPDMMIGTVESFEMDETQTSYTAAVRLSVDMSRLQNVLIVRNEALGEVAELEERVRNSYN